MRSTAFSPGHITGIVKPHIYSQDHLKSGSRGVGFSIKAGVTTKVEVEPASATDITVRINGRRTCEAAVSKYVAKTFVEMAGGGYSVSVDHKVDIPIGAGFGSSGSAALSLALALNEALKLGLSRVEAAQVAHIAEVVCGTGLGTVLAEMCGGFEYRVRPGGPGVGEVENIRLDGEYILVALSFGPVSKPHMLDRLICGCKASRLADHLLNHFSSEKSVENFLRLARMFVKALGLDSGMPARVLGEADARGFICSVALFGETVFSLVKPDDAEELRRIFMRNMVSGSSMVMSRIDSEGARLM